MDGPWAFTWILDGAGSHHGIGWSVGCLLRGRSCFLATSLLFYAGLASSCRFLSIFVSEGQGGVLGHGCHTLRSCGHRMLLLDLFVAGSGARSGRSSSALVELISAGVSDATLARSGGLNLARASKIGWTSADRICFHSCDRCW